ncbi:hypothetical protein [Pseudomonas corrugata]|uniref:hypothetical protein n=1 Tax=Pseudomonas corrugata TaxID=47879 RepID=UPI0030B8F5F9
MSIDHPTARGQYLKTWHPGRISLGCIHREVGLEMMDAAGKTKVAQIFDQLLALRESVNALQEKELRRVIALRGQQTVDVDEAVHQSFVDLQNHIAGMEEVLATIAEATGIIPKL